MQKSAVPILVFRCLIHRVLCMKDNFIKFVEKKKKTHFGCRFYAFMLYSELELKDFIP